MNDTHHPSASTTEVPSSVADGGLVVVSNRQPYSHDYAEDGGGITVDAPAGGLTAGLDPVMQEVGGTWIAWGDGEADETVTDEEDCVPAPPDDPGYTLKRLWFSEEEVRDYYYGFSNQVLWPVCHSALTAVHGEEPFGRRYREVNERFAEAVVERADPGSVVWFQDYHLALTPRMVREQLSGDTPLMHFWHIPWPSRDAFRGCPRGRTLLRGLLGNDLLGFHVERYCRNFLECVEADLDGATVDREAGTVEYDGHVTRVMDIPLGVPVSRIERGARSAQAESFWSSFADRHDLADTVAVGVDRLDYTKGIPERLRALELFWERNPGWQGRLTYVQNGSESRSQIPAYRAVQERVSEAVDRINRRFGTDDWQPVVSFRDYLPREALAGLYRNSGVALVSPIRDGMNLVAQEYVAAQTENDGVLVLSDQAGAHELLGDAAITVNPHDTGPFATAIREALTLSTRGRRTRMSRLRELVAANDLATWMNRNLHAADQLLERAGPPVREASL